MSGLFDISGANSLASGAESGGVFSDDTTINFSGFQTANPVNSQGQTLDPTANATAALGGGAETQDAQKNGGGAVSPASTPVNWQLILLAAAGIFVVGTTVYVLKKKKII